MDTEALAATCARLLQEKKAEDILVLHVEHITSIADYFVIATGRNVRHLRALAQEIEEAVNRLRLSPLGVEGTPESGWVLVDLGAVVVHLFDPVRRELYSLEVLWGDAPRTDWAALPPLQEEALEP